MKCPMCDGRRTMFTREQPGVGTQFGEIKLVVCPKCNGTGEVDENSRPILTNEEWLKQCTTEQLAEFLADKCNEVVETVLSDASCDIGDIDNDDYWYRQADFVEWLKEKHE